MAAVRLVLIQTILMFLSSFNSFAQPASTLFTKDGCQEFCGSVRIPYPFGIGADYCYLDPWFEIVCETESFGSTQKPLLKGIKGRLEVLAISSRASTLTVNYNVSASCSTNGPTAKSNMEFEKSPFAFSENNNIFIAMGCNNSASMWSLDERISFGGCKSPCDKAESFINGSRGCDGRSNCCQTEIPYDLNSFITTIEPKNNSSINGSSECNYAFLVEKNWFKKNFTILYPKLSVPVVLKWGIDPKKFPSKLFHGRKQYRCDLHDPTMLGNHNFTISTYTCACAPGYKGNPYLPQLHGCQDIDECENPELNRCTDSRCKNTDGGYHCTDSSTITSIIIGISTSQGALFLIIGGWWSYKVIKKGKMMKQRKKFFQRNGGLLLQQQLSMTEANLQNANLFNQKELEMATNYFHVNRILGQGGQGTVYKGMLADGRIVAIKKSKVMDEGKLKEFINEVVILSGINHRNVVKLLGCCLETEVPLLVYEYVPNGTVFQYLSDQNEEFPLTWDMRLRIATEVAGALFYLHSFTSSPIYHRDIKSSNILLDDNHRAKVADFGISRSIAIDQTHLSTLVHGTFGYIDPEYFQSGQFTEKSDVYSFGVVLAELLTGDKAISSTRSPATKSLASYIIRSMEENVLFDILDNQVLKEAKKAEIVLVADLVKRCLYWNGRNRPTMKEVTMELEAIQMSRKASNLEQDYNEEVEFVRSEAYIQSCDASTSKSKITCTDSGVTSFMDSHSCLSS